jgi:hypothetical protein
LEGSGKNLLVNFLLQQVNLGDFNKLTYKFCNFDINVFDTFGRLRMLDARKYGILDCLFSLLRNSFP